MSKTSLRARLTLQFAFTLTVLYMAMSLVLIWNARRTANSAADRILNAAAKRIKLYLKEGGLPLVTREAPTRMMTDGLGLVIVNSKNEPIFKSQPSVPTWPRTEDGWRTISGISGDNRIVLGIPLSKTDESMRKLYTVLLIQAIFVPLLGYLGGWILVGRTLSPIARLSRQASTAQGDGLHTELKSPTADAEVVGLVETLNGLLGRHAETVASRGRFYAAASHELRTPLQALSGHLEVALSKSRSPEEYKAALDEANAQTKKLSALVRDLLFLNHLDAVGPELSRESVNLGEVCEIVLARVTPTAGERGIVLVKQIPPDIEIEAPSNHTDMLVRNLIENADKYCTRGGKVVVELDKDHGKPILSIYNDCPPLSVYERERLFEPFYRPDASRNSKTGGNGLGLAICKAISSANDWPIGLTQETSGLRVTVTFGEKAQNAS